jgi:hypothetical protein
MDYQSASVGVPLLESTVRMDWDDPVFYGGYFLASQAGGLYLNMDDGNSYVLSTLVTAGLVLSKDKTTLYAAHAGKMVGVYSTDSWTLIGNFSLEFEPGLGGGLCLNEDDTMLFVTAPGYTMDAGALMFGNEPIEITTPEENGFAIISLTSKTTGDIVTMFTGDAENRAFNGCVVVGTDVFLVQFQKGVAKFDPYTYEFTNTVSWSHELAALQDGFLGGPKLAGDGLTFHDGLFYVSCWSMVMNFGQTQPAANSGIWACDPDCESEYSVVESCCAKVTSSLGDYAAADIGIFVMGDWAEADIEHKLVMPEVLSSSVGTVSVRSLEEEYMKYMPDDDTTTMAMPDDKCMSVPSSALAAAREAGWEIASC